MPEELIITFANTHQAIQGERTLLEAKLAVCVMPMPGSISAGCGLCLRLPFDCLAEAKATLQTQNVEVQAFYRVDGGAYVALDNAEA